MWPWGHLLFGAFAYFGYRRIRQLGTSRVSVGLSLTLGTQFPDLVDKPLAWYVGVLPTGRSLAHSIFTFFLVAVVLTQIGWRVDRDEAVFAFLFGYFTHIVGDIIPPLLDGERYYATFFLWPALPAVDYGTELTLLPRLRALDPSPVLFVQFGLLTLVAIGWYLRARTAHS
ncbi:metal-dependent hydrolase [Haloferax chudinovii]|uniref:Metal-dependent hydrolase n=1 Tax=Haloferax chudinovii TaxID=1109010 RepID=A0ABD5XFR6_9EURY